MSKMLIVDDEEKIRAVVREYAEFEDFEVTEARDGMEAVALCRENDYDIIIMDVMMPRLDGYSACKEIRKQKSIPIIMLSARGEEYDKLFGFETGIDDYVVKPFGIMELQARVKAVLRRTERRGDRVLTWGDVELDPAAREVHKAGKPVELTYKEFELLKLLFSRRGVALTRDEILQAVWDYDYTGETRTVDMHVKALRQKLGEDIITTVRGVGYKMV